MRKVDIFLIFRFLFIFVLLLFCSKVYAYDEYHIGKKVSYNGVDYYVIENSGDEKKYVTLLKALPLNMQEINDYSSDTQSTSYVALMSYVPYQDAWNYQFEYTDSYVKPVVDYWANNEINPDDLVTVEGYNARILNDKDLNNLGYAMVPIYSGQIDQYGARIIGYNFEPSGDPVEWLNYNNEKMLTSFVYRWVNFSSPEKSVYIYDPSKGYFSATKGGINGVVRPVINLKKAAIEGQTDYSFGSEITYKNEKYNIITSADDYVVALKWEPITKRVYNAAVSDISGTISYYSTSTCAYGDNNISGCTNDYNQSNVKKIVDSWANDNTVASDLVDVNGYSTRILTRDDLTNNLGYTMQSYGTEAWEIRLSYTSSTPTFVYQYANNVSDFWYISTNENQSIATAVLKESADLKVYEYSQVRPVINLSKCALGDEACTVDDEMVCKEGTKPVTKKVLRYSRLKTGDKVKINNDVYYVIKNSSKSSKNVLLMKAEPLNASQINKYVDHNYFVSEDGEVPYILNSGCYYLYDRTLDTYDAKIDYCRLVPFDSSTVKAVIAGWANDSFEDGVLETVDGYKARLISMEDLLEDLNYELNTLNTSSDEFYNYTEATPSVFKNYDKVDWSMTSGDYNPFIYDGHSFEEGSIVEYYQDIPRTAYLRPVIVANKEYVEGGSYEDDVIIGCETEDGEIIPVDPPVDVEEEIIEVESTLSQTSLMSMIISIILIAAGLAIVYFNYKKSLKERF